MSVVGYVASGRQRCSLPGAGPKGLDDDGRSRGAEAQVEVKVEVEGSCRAVIPRGGGIIFYAHGRCGSWEMHRLAASLST